MDLIPGSSKWSRRRSHAGLVLFLAMASTALPPRTAAARTWHVPGDAPTIQAGIDLAQPGDDVLVAPGTYYEHDIAMKGGVWVHSEGGPSVTVVDGENVSRVFDCNQQAGIVTLEGFAIRNGNRSGNNEHDASGGGVRCLDSQLTIRHCLISDCASTYDGGGIYTDGGDLDVESSTVADCSADFAGGGILAWGWTFRLVETEILRNVSANMDGGVAAGALTVEVIRCVVSGNGAAGGVGGLSLGYGGNMTIQDCLISHNAVYGEMTYAAGLGLYHCTGTVDGCTIASSIGSPGFPAAYIQESNVQFERTLIAFNQGRAVECWAGAVVAWRCCDLYGNAGDQICGNDLGGNFSADPLFCDAQNGDYTLDANSPCLPGNHPDGVDCGLIGARDQGCGATPTRPTTWGRIKAGFR